ncbi:protein SPT2 homolog [Drosophila guanche]|uniref:Protein SPT2 homolog n=1 Tax=Drosophila guanche TaxID=7266 RepID=A0A3B0KEJ3_DROGU|nr:protein SPT2 homolog [Drosophila guanche]SPP86740.1 blast:Protein SPT2 homolog [Drosophila guanche]
MNFGELLHLAKKKTDAATNDEGKYYSTKYAPPKKESKASKELSSNIQKFLKKREAEEQERKRVERQKLNELLAKRDEKSKNKIRKMLKVTKSANKSVLEDAHDGNGQNGGDQGEGEGDDYGYVSTESNAFYQKYIEKVRDVNDDKGFAPSRPQSAQDLSGTKERVKAAITREREEAMSHTRQRSSSDARSSSGASATSSSSKSKSREAHVARAYSTCRDRETTVYNPEAERLEEERKKREAEKKRAKAKRPPPMDFQAVLRLAAKTQHEPVVYAQPEKKKEPERLLSAREKREMEERQRQREQRAERDRLRESEAKAKEQHKNGSGSGSGSRMEASGRIPKVSSSSSSTSSSSSGPAASSRPSTPSLNESKAKPNSDNVFKRPAPRPAPPPSSGGSSSSSRLPASAHNPFTKPDRSRLPATATTAKSLPAKPILSNKTSSESIPVRGPSAVRGPVASARLVPIRIPYGATGRNGPAREFPPRDRPAGGSPTRTRQFPPADVQRSGNRAMPAGRGKPQGKTPPTKRRHDDDDDDYDSELDDFIDDGDCEEDISSHIRDIFGYDKRRYRDLDDDDSEMESSFAQMQREEFLSGKMGMQEDLEDMRMEAIHKKRKMARRKATRIDD